MQTTTNKRALRKYDGRKHEWFHLAKTVVLTVIAVLIIAAFVVGFSRVDGNSMYPTLKNGQAVAYLRVDRSIEYGDIVAIKMTSGEGYVKRVIGMPGDVIELKDGCVYRNGDMLYEPYLATQEVTEPEEDNVEYPYTVGEGTYFVLGDNREHSTDSRAFGAVIKQNSKGVILNQ